ncbi:MAG TPA: metallophosphoesterase [Gammaproteobacteria bacterium]|nr:metallophosphoesterase [Gammaproteobacteria bacterium]
MKCYLKICLAYFLLFPVLSFGKSNNFLTLSDIHLNVNVTPNSMMINPSTPRGNKDDMDPATFNRLISLLAMNIQNGTVAKPDFIILLGDLVGHDSTPEDAAKAETFVFNKLKITFPQIPIFYTFGNNDSLTQDYGTFSRTASPKSAYDIARNNLWEDGFLSIGKKCPANPMHFPCIIHEDTTNGFYSASIQPGFRLISLNSVLFSQKRKDVSDDPATAELKWLDTELQAAESTNPKESVLIVMHIPPGKNVYNDSAFWQTNDETTFLNLVNTHHSIITCILSSHTHAEELKVIKNNENSIAGVYFTAALSTSHGNAPSVKTFYYAVNNGKWVLSDTTTYNFTGDNKKVSLNRLYDFTNVYCDQYTFSLSDCLKNVTADKMKRYFSAGNPNFGGVLDYPGDIVIKNQ